jgi:hypothetical protein
MLILLVLAGGAILLAGGAAYVLVSRAGRGRWATLTGEAARRLSGRASGSEIRAEVDGLTVTVRLEESRPRGSATSTVALPGGAGARLYFGWDRPPPPEMEHIPNVDVRTRVAGSVVTKAEDAAFASRVIDAVITELIDVRREADAAGLSVACRGGYATLTVVGLTASPFLIERIAVVSARAARAIAGAAAGTLLTAGPVEARVCTICEAGGEGEAWVACRACAAPYHRSCFEQATACVAGGCDGREAG